MSLKLRFNGDIERMRADGKPMDAIRRHVRRARVIELAKPILFTISLEMPSTISVRRLADDVSTKYSDSVRGAVLTEIERHLRALGYFHDYAANEWYR